MLSTKIRTTIIALVAASSFAATSVVPAVSQAATTEKDLKGKGYTCEHASTNNTVCTDKEGHEWYCEESSDECGQVKLELVNTIRPVPSVGLYAAPEATTPPVVKVRRPTGRMLAR
jgi:hypothetical protein